jgi:hypothetical protein
MILLLGEQPVPNLLPVLHEKPDMALMLYTQRTDGQRERLSKVLSGRVNYEAMEVPPYDIVQIRRALENRLSEGEWRDQNVIFNLTGGTKPMAFAAYELAVHRKKDFLYFQTEGKRSLIYRYTTTNGAQLNGQPVEVPPLLTIDDYLRLYLGGYAEEGAKEPFERLVGEALRQSPIISEIKAGVRGLSALEIDLVIRCGNQVGVAEVKRHAKKQGIDQLNSATEQRYLGTYTEKFLVSAAPLDPNNRELADAYKIKVIELQSGEGKALTAQDVSRLIQVISSALGANQ